MAQDFVIALKRITRWSLWSAAGCMLLVTLLHFLLPLLLDSQALKQSIQARLDPEVYGSFDFGKLRIALLPLPAMVASQGSYSLPGRVQLQAAEVAFRPHILSLLRGRVRLDTLAVQAPSAVIDLPGPSSGAPKDPGRSRGELTERLSAALSRLPQDARVLLDEGSITLRQAATPVIHIEKLTLALVENNGRLQLNLAGGSDLIERFLVTAMLDGRTLDGQGEITLNGIRFEALSDRPLPQSAQRGLIKAAGDLHLSFENKGLQSLKATLRSDFPDLTLARGAKWVRAREVSIEAGAELSSQGLRADLRRLHIEQPRLSLDGSLAWDVGGDSDPPALQLDANLRDTDVTAMRAAMMVMTGPDRPWKLWDTIRGGTLQEMTLHAVGETWRDLGSMRNLHLSGKAAQARIVIPGVQLDLTDVNGTWRLEEGVLTVAPGATARHGDIQANGGSLTVGLTGTPNSIDLSLAFQADLAGLPALLTKLIRSEKVRAELARVGSTHGQAAGNVRLGGTLQDLHVQVAARNIELSAKYDRLPLPLRIQGPELTYDDGRILFSRMDAGMGASALTAVSGRIAWQQAPELAFQGRAARLAAEELFPWLRGLPGLQAKTAGIQSIAGTLYLTDFAAAGPPAAIGRWQLQGTGDFENLIMTASRLSEPFSLADGRFSLSKVPASENQDLRLDVRQVKLACAEQHAALSGTILFSPEKWAPALVLTADRLDLGRLAPLLKSSPASSDSKDARPESGAKIAGRVAVAIEQLIYGSYRWEPIRAEATMADGQTLLEVTQANLCGISTPGRIVWNDQGMRLEVKPDARGPNARYTGGCLFGADSTERIEGTLDIHGSLAANGRSTKELLASMGGKLNLNARDGRITNVGRVGLFTNLLSFLSINGILSGDGHNLTENDLPYKRIDIVLSIHDGVAELQEAKVTAKPVNIVGEGRVDLITREVAVMLLVSPLTTADAVVQRIPVVGRILKGTLVAVPVEVKGSLTNPAIFPLSPKAVGSRLLGIMERTVTAPLQLVEPIWRTPEATP